MLRRTLCLLAASAIAATSAPAAGPPEDDARRAVEKWLALVDAGAYAASWSGAGALFRGAVTQDQWAKASSGARQPLGPLKKRSLKSTQATRTLPGAPDGQYVVIQFDAGFAQREAAVETVTATLEPDGAWRVVGYFIK